MTLGHALPPINSTLHAPQSQEWARKEGDFHRDGDIIYGFAFRYRFPQAPDAEDEQSAAGDDAVGSAKDDNRKGDN